MIDKEQIQILFEQFSVTQLTENEFITVATSQDAQALKLTDEQLLSFLQIANSLYRSGFPVVDDSFYDVLRAEFVKRQPDHPFVIQVESELLVQAKTVELPVKMLSTDKAYSRDEIDRWLMRIEKVAIDLSIDFTEVLFRVTPKLDGYAAFDDGLFLYTRGDGVRGQDISRVFDLGLKVGGNGQRGQGAGEIVIAKPYFDDYLAPHFENTRNIQAAILAEKNVSPIVKQAIDDGAALFFPFAQLPDWQGNVFALNEQFDVISREIWQSTDYEVDGLVIECTHAAIKEQMGATRHHHRWQIAFKVNADSAQVKVLQVTPQTSRTGRITPVVELEPTKLSGAMISRATAHHYQMVKTKGIGKGALIKLVRSGLVIPKIEEVLQAVEPDLPSYCPSCHSELEWDGDNLFCLNKSGCSAQAENTMIHFFQTLGNIDGFGPATMRIFYQNGITKISEIYQLGALQLEQIGYKEKTIQNLLAQLQASRQLEIEDWRFLGAFGVARLGLGSSERLLEYYDLPDVFNLNQEQMCTIDGFAQKSAQLIIDGLALIRDEFFAIYNLGFNLRSTRLQRQQQAQNGNDGVTSSIYNKTVVFTGTMMQGSRTDMEKQAKVLGAKVAKSVSGATDYLIIGEKVGANKINAAKDKGVALLTETEYLQLINLTINR